MKLVQLLGGLQYVVIQGQDKWEDTEVRNLSYHSEEVRPGSLFVCIHGKRADGHAYIEKVANAGAKVLLVERILSFPEHVIVVLVKDTREALAHLSAIWFGEPAKRLKIIGITGTKGKTTTSYMIYHLLKAAGKEVGLIGTIETIIGEERISSGNTTPESFTIHSYFDKMVKIGCEYVVMEVSSQGIMQKRVDGIPFTIAIFTNFERDHIGEGEHASLEEYRYYKARLFQQCEIGIGNLDDMQCRYMFQRSPCQKYGFTCKRPRGKKDQRILVGEHIRFLKKEEGLQTEFEADGRRFHLAMPGVFNVYNALAALQTVKCLQVEIPHVEKVLASVNVNGRMQQIYLENDIACYIDYAHNAGSLRRVLRMLRSYQISRIILVFGCGGNRAKMRRTEMGQVAGRLADVVIVTSDNPRFEKPQEIIHDIIEGIESVKGNYLIVEERKEAIHCALSMAEAGDAVLVAGKGHEAYQEIAGRRYEQSDYELVCQWRDDVRRYYH